MTECENPLAVRWDTEHEEADTLRLLKAVGDDFAILLDRDGWQITLKACCKPEVTDKECLWPMNQKTTAMPLWAHDLYAPKTPERKIAYRPYPNVAQDLFGWFWVNDDTWVVPGPKS